ncbi:MAG: N-methylhydantoinase [Solirubrobacteraceae bacterium]|jgi:N-methylhydantoinase A|nr:N-methylhydantoinase [Solirubrobacteraceae bacterium]
MSLSIGVDIGGTFTDGVVIDDEGRLHQAKVLSTHDTGAADGVLAVIEALGGGELLGKTGRVAHGTTIGTNLLVERKGADVVVVTTAGHGDALTMMRGAGRTAGLPIEQVFDVQETSKPVPLVQRAAVVELHERIDAAGEVVAPLDDDRAREALQELLSAGPGGVAVTLLWSFRNDEHEQRVGELVRELAPDAFVSLSSEVAPRQGEFERAVATLVNSYVGPASVAYLDDLAGRLGDAGFDGDLFVMQSNGGVVGIDAAQRRPLGLIGSGPAGGVAGVALLAARNEHTHVVATDMGGTSFEVGLIVDGRPLVAGQQVVEQHTFHQPNLDTRSIACGGGSIARVDSEGGLRVGPHSAGSSPGPAAYGRGGEEATVTDADVVLGLLSPEAFLGGDLELDVEAARAAVQKIADGLGLELEEAAAGILRVNNHAAATLIRQRTLEQGLDPRDFVLYAYGGAGPLHAFGYAAELGVSEVVVPLGNGASTLSAYGIAAGDLIQHHELETRLQAPLDAAALADAVARGEEEAGVGLSDPQMTRVALMRYAEQYLQTIAVTLPDGDVDDAACEELLRRFDAEYERQFGPFAKALFQAVEVFGVRVEARVPAEVPAVDDPAPSDDAEPREPRSVVWPEHGRAETAVYSGLELASGQRIDGPAVVELPHTTVGVAPGQSLTRDATGLRLNLGGTS